MPPPDRYVAGNFQLVIDGVKTGFLKSVDGGSAVAEVVSEMVGSSMFAKKHLGQVEYSPFLLQFPVTMSAALIEWINASWTGHAQRKDGAIIASDISLNAVSQREFSDALIAETTIPALDGSSKEAGYLTVKVVPEAVRTGKASGKVTNDQTKAKMWISSNFRVAIDGLDCSRITSVDSFTVKQVIAVEDLGNVRNYRLEPGRLEFPDLKITVAEAGAKSWFDWFDEFVIKGNSDESKEKKGSIALLSPDLKDELLRVDLFNLGIFRIGQDKFEANAERISTVTAYLYCERMELYFEKAPRAPASRATG